VDGTVDWIEELPKNRGRGVTENRAIATSENRGHEAGLEIRGAVSHGVDALVDSVEMTISKAFGDCVLADTDLTELARGDDAVLARGNSREERPRGVAFFPHGWE